jgi:hypothetical protein
LGTRAVIFDADESNTRLTMVRKIVGEGTDRFPDSVTIRRIPLAFDAIDFTPLQELLQIIVGERHVHLKLEESVASLEW